MEMYRIPVVALIVAVSGCAASTTIDPAGPLEEPDRAPIGETVAVSRIFDGDSLEVRHADGTSAEVRLLGINAPEGSECHGDPARGALESLLTDGEITLVTDEEQHDQFGRLLRYVYSDGVNANLEMVANGNAVALQSGHRLEPAFVDAAATAAASRRGLWSTTACGNAGRAPDVRIDRYEYDPAGSDTENANDEWVVLANRDKDTVMLGGWILRDESTQNRFVLPDGFRLSHGDEVKIHSGCGIATATDLYWCAADPVWSNGGDTIILQLPDGTIVAWEQFDGKF